MAVPFWVFQTKAYHLMYENKEKQETLKSLFQVFKSNKKTDLISLIDQLGRTQNFCVKFFETTFFLRYIGDNNLL